MRQLVLIVICTVICFRIFTFPVYAAFGVSPADLTFDYLTPGMTVEEEFLVSRSDTNNEANVSVETDIDGANDWVKIEPDNNFTISKGKQTETMKVVITVPDDAEYKTYKGYLTLKIVEGENTAGVSIIGGVGIAVNLTLTKMEVAKLLVRRLDLPNINQGEPIKLTLATDNKGNKKTTLEKVEMIVRDIYGNELFKGKYSSFDQIEPGKKSDLIAEFDNELIVGEYNVDVSAYFQGEQIRKDNLVFSVLKKPEGTNKELMVISKGRNDWISLLKLVFLSIIPIIFIWIIIRKKYV